MRYRSKCGRPRRPPRLRPFSVVFWKSPPSVLPTRALYVVVRPPLLALAVQPGRTPEKPQSQFPEPISVSSRSGSPAEYRPECHRSPPFLAWPCSFHVPFDARSRGHKQPVSLFLPVHRSGQAFRPFRSCTGRSRRDRCRRHKPPAPAVRRQTPRPRQSRKSVIFAGQPRSGQSSTLQLPTFTHANPA